MAPVPLNVNGQFGIPGMAAVPLTVIETAVPLICPDTLPSMASPPPQTAVNVPVIAEAFWLVIWYLKFPHVLGSGSVGIALADAQVPTRDGVAGVLPTPGPLPVPFPALGVVPVDVGTEVGTRTLVVCSKPQAVVIRATARLATIERGLFI
jgi:hypothetical protein